MDKFPPWSNLYELQEQLIKWPYVQIPKYIAKNPCYNF